MRITLNPATSNIFLVYKFDTEKFYNSIPYIYDKNEKETKEHLNLKKGDCVENSKQGSQKIQLCYIFITILLFQGN